LFCNFMLNIPLPLRLASRPSAKLLLFPPREECFMLHFCNPPQTVETGASEMQVPVCITRPHTNTHTSSLNSFFRGAAAAAVKFNALVDVNSPWMFVYRPFIYEIQTGRCN
jgi:hypothetical protein